MNDGNFVFIHTLDILGTFLVDCITLDVIIIELVLHTTGHGLPAGLAEVEMIERARQKRAW